MELNASPYTASFWLNGTPIITNVALDARWSSGPTTVLFGSDWSTQGAQTLHFDNITVEVTP
jgi:hypothetical protein